MTKRQNHLLPMKQSLVEQVSKVLAKVPIVKNLARRKFVCLFILGLIKSRNVQFCEVAQHLNEETKLSSNEVRIQDFFRQADIDYFFVAALLVSLLPTKGKLRLCIDRTEWDFGSCQVNILMVIASTTNMQVPLYWELLDNKSGNSSSEDRISLLKMCVKLLGKERIGLVIGDREFVGHAWMKYLKENNLLFVMRLPKHHLIERIDGRRQTLTDFDLSPEKPLQLTHCLVDGVVGHVWVKALPEEDYLYLFGNAKVDYFGQFYRKRWTIETVFQAFKKRGFNLENTHLKMLAKLKKLVALVSIAYSICVSLGIYAHQKIQKIKTKKHGYKAKSFARKGIDSIREVFRQGKEMPQYLLNRFLSLLRSILMQSTHYQLLKMVG